MRGGGGGPSALDLTVLRLRFVETTGDADAWLQQTKRQWGGGMGGQGGRHGGPIRLSVRVLSGGGSQALGTSPPQPVAWDQPVPLQLEGLLTVPLPLGVAVLIFEVLAHHALGVIPVAIGHLDVGAVMASTSVSWLQETLHLIPCGALTDATVHGILDVAFHRAGAEEPPPCTPLDFLFGAVRTSCTDIYFPSIICTQGDGDTTRGAGGMSSPTAAKADPEGGGGMHVVSNVVCVANATDRRRIAICVERRSATSTVNAMNLKVLPSDLVFLSPGQKAYMSFTWDPFASSKATSSAHIGRTPSIELDVTDVETGDPFPSAPLVVHFGPPQGDGLLRPYHYWVNAAVMTNHPLPPFELPFVRSVLPVFLIQLAADDGDASPPPDGEGGVAGQELSLSGSGFARDMDTHEVYRVGPVTFGPPVVQMAAHSAAQLLASTARTMDLTKQGCNVTFSLGVVHGLPPTDGSAFHVVLSSLSQGWTVTRGESEFAYQTLPSGTLRWDGLPLAIAKTASATPRPLLRLTLFEASSLTDGGDEIPIAVASIELWPLHHTRIVRTIPLCFAVFDSYSRFDDLESTGLWARGARATLTPE